VRISRQTADTLSLTGHAGAPDASIIDAENDGKLEEVDSVTGSDGLLEDDRPLDWHLLKASTVRTALWVLGVSVAMGLLESFKSFVSSEAQHQPIPLLNLLQQNLPWYVLWSFLAPVIFWLGARFRLDDRDRLPYTLPIHFAAAAILASLHVTAAAFLFFHQDFSYMPVAARAWLPKTTGQTILRWHNLYLVMDMVTYGVMLGLYYALDYQRRLRSAALESVRLRAQSAQLQHRITEARLQALRMELNPHFLFNALNSISALVRKKENTAAVNMIASLGDLLRATLERGAKSEMPLGDELRLVDLYLDIAKVRFGDRLETIIDVPPLLREAMVPTLVLQPLVENAVRHGIGETGGAVSITISAHEDAESLVLEVEDTGVGLSNSEEFKPSEGIGLSNTRARLKQLYGTGASLTISNAPSRGAVARIRMPLQIN
jgi:sensor histidine kinase YesM